MIVAALDTVEGGVVELEAEVLLLGLSDGKDEGLGTAFTGDFHGEMLAHLVELVADDVFDGGAVEREEAVALDNARFGGGAVGNNAIYCAF